MLPVAAGKTSATTPAAATGTSTSDSAKPTKTKNAQEGEKVVIRRLPAGLTEDEFQTILGDEWKEGNGKVGWCSFHAGKVSKE